MPSQPSGFTGPYFPAFGLNTERCHAKTKHSLHGKITFGSYFKKRVRSVLDC